MTRPLIAVTADPDIKQFLCHLESPVYLAEDLGSVPELFDEALMGSGVDPVVVVGSDITQDFDGSPSPFYEVVLLYTDAEAVDWHGLFALSPAQVIHLPNEWGALGGMIEATFEEFPWNITGEAA
jgi:hypothetical protein